MTFRYDQAWEFIDAIRSQRPCRPDFFDALKAQVVMDAALKSAEIRGWIEIPTEAYE